MSFKISIILSKPAETLIKPGVIPTSVLSSSVNLECVVEAGWVTIVRVSPRFADNEHKVMLFKTARPQSKPP